MNYVATVYCYECSTAVGTVQNLGAREEPEVTPAPNYGGMDDYGYVYCKDCWQCKQ